MERTILESVSGSVEVYLEKRDGTLLFKETSNMAGIELSEAAQLIRNER
ncbi:MAG TPA: hypothetical protein VJ863_02430 [Sphaerochaeta sp.]|nr:hypothetical protein [Sphaerochaeta sp.]